MGLNEKRVGDSDPSLLDNLASLGRRALWFPNAFKVFRTSSSSSDEFWNELFRKIWSRRRFSTPDGTVTTRPSPVDWDGDDFGGSDQTYAESWKKRPRRGPDDEDPAEKARDGAEKVAEESSKASLPAEPSVPERRTRPSPHPIPPICGVTSLATIADDVWMSIIAYSQTSSGVIDDDVWLNIIAKEVFDGATIAGSAYIGWFAGASAPATISDPCSFGPIARLSDPAVISDGASLGLVLRPSETAIISDTAHLWPSYRTESQAQIGSTALIATKNMVSSAARIGDSISIFEKYHFVDVESGLTAGDPPATVFIPIQYIDVESPIVAPIVGVVFEDRHVHSDSSSPATIGSEAWAILPAINCFPNPEFEAPASTWPWTLIPYPYPPGYFYIDAEHTSIGEIGVATGSDSYGNYYFSPTHGFYIFGPAVGAWVNVDTQPSTTYRIEFMYRYDSGFHTTYLSAGYSATHWNDYLSSSRVTNVGSGWHRYSNTFTTTSGANGYTTRITFKNFGIGLQVARLDSFYMIAI